MSMCSVFKISCNLVVRFIVAAVPIGHGQGCTAAVRPAAAKASAPQLAVGDRIVHDRFGRGVVVALEGEGDAGKARIDFEQVGVKTLLMKFAKITRNK